jgi:SsrA-binding protein|tara:strand:+ start:1615 stop:2088 length:474 start_codon:yes stop_codon:yes gene_type:complete
MAKKKLPDRQIAAQNRKARHDFFIDENIEAGLVLQGSEVKSLRSGQGSLVDAWAGEKDNELWMYSAYIPQYASAHEPNYISRRPRKMLLHKREMDRLLASIKRDGVTLVPLSIYFNNRGIAKVDLGVARGKRKYDKRQTEKKRDWERQKSRLLREKG